MNNYKVSIIIPVYNTEKYIHKCVDSVLGQTYNNIEVILVDDESPDRCSEICDEYSKIDNRIKVIHKKNSGLGFTRNAGLEHVSGDFVTFLDSDDWIDSNHIENLLNPYLSDSVDLVIGSYKRCSNEEELIRYEKQHMEGKFSDKSIVAVAMLMVAPPKDYSKDVGIPMSVCFNLYKVDIVHKYSLKFPSERDTVGEDLFFNLEYLKNCKHICIIESYGYNYRANPTSITRKYNPERVNRTISYYRRLLSIAPGYKNSNEFVYRVQRSTLSKLRVALSLIVGENCKLSQKRVMIKHVLNTEDIIQLLNEYPIKTYRMSIRIATYMMKYKFTWGVLLIFAIKNKYKR